MHGWWLALALIAAGITVYANGLGAPFILDDEDTIVRNPFIGAVWPLHEAMRAPAQSSAAGRPLISLSFAISRALSGNLSPYGFRIWNLAVLIATALLLAGIVARTIRRTAIDELHAERLALAAALLWLLHPLNSEVVGYVTQRTESMMGMFYLLTIYAAMRAIDTPATGRRWTTIAIVACAAGMACKESMVTAPLMVLLYDRVFGAGSIAAALKQRRWLYAGLAATWVLLLLLNVSAPRSGSAGFATATPVATYLMNQGVMIVTYLKLAIFPYPLIIDYGRTAPIALENALPYLLAVSLLAIAVAWTWTRHRVAAFLGTAFFVTLAPTSSVVPIATEVGAERRMFLPLMALMILLVLSLRRWAPRYAIAIAIALSIAFGALTFARNFDYYDHVALWQSVVDHHPHGRAHYNLAIALKAAGRDDEAIAHYDAALPGEPSAYYALGFEASQAGRYADALINLQEFLRLRPVDVAAPKAWLLRGEALVRLGRLEEADAAFRSALQLAPGFADALGQLADVQFNREQYAGAIETYREYLALLPNSVNARHSLGLALALSGRETEAVAEFAAAVALRPGDAQLRKSLGTALSSTGRIDEAIAQYREGLRLAPGDEGLRREYAAALSLRK